jgi:pyridoxine 5-phosphate synthase
MRLAVNIDHFATLREARRSNEPEPVLAALLAEQAGAAGIVCHIRADRRHIKERDLNILQAAIKTKLIVEMAATDEMMTIAREIKPEIVSLVPEKPEELTTEGGLDVISNQKHLASHIKDLQQAGIKVSVFVDPSHDQIEICQQLGCDMIEINTGKYADLKPGGEQQQALNDIISAAEFGQGLGLKIHAGHGLDYMNIHPVAAIPEIEEFSIGFSIVARAAIVGIDMAVREMATLVD